jgi:hypothetical protein
LSIVVLGQVEVVGATHQAHVVGRVVAAHGEGMEVVVLESVALGATATGLVSIATATVVALEHRPPYGRGDVAHGRRKPSV